MLTAQAKDTVLNAKGSRKVSLVVLVHASDQFDEIIQTTDRMQRINKMKSFYREAKRPFLDMLSEYTKLGLKVTNELDGTPNLVVSGPASVWKKFFDEKVTALTSPAFEVFPNTPDWSTDH